MTVVTLAAGLQGAAAAVAPVAADYIVVFRDSVNTDPKIDQVEQQGSFSAEFRYHSALKGFAAQLTDAQVARLAGDPEVAYVTPSLQVHAIGTVPITPGDSAPTGVRRIEAATATTAHEASTVNVAVIDTGVDLTHPDLNAVSGKNCLNPSSPAQDDSGHGSHVAGTIAARNNNAGVVGVAPGTKVYAVKVLDNTGSGSDAQVICGIDWVTQNTSALNIKVVNMSLGRSGSNDNNCGNTNGDAMHTAICNSTAAGVAYAVAAGNSGSDLADFSPADYPEVLAVTAMSDSDGRPGGLGGAPTCRPAEGDDTPAAFSDFAVATTEINHTIAAPGVCISSTWKAGGYNTISGTSMASPHVAGSIALCMGNGGVAGPCAGMTPAQVIQKMRSDAAAHTAAVPGYGFTRDPDHGPTAGRYYGYLVYDGTPTGPSFSLSSNPSSVSFVAGATKTFDVTVTPSGGFSDPVTLSAASSSANLSVTPASAPATTGPFTVTFTVGSSTPASYTATITGTSTSLTRSLTVNVNVTPPPTAPGAPTLSATAGNSNVHLSWTPPANNGGSAITAYQVYRSTTSGTETALGSPRPGSATSFDDTSVVNGTRYFYQVTASNVVGEGPRSNEVAATPLTPPTPLAAIDVFVRQGDGGVWTRHFDGTSWSGYVSLGGFITSDIASVSDGSRVWIFARGGDNALYFQRRAANGVWSGWQPMGGVVSSNPAAAWDPVLARVRVFVRGGDNALYTALVNDASVAQGWVGMGGFISSNPSAAADGTGVRVVVRGGDDAGYTSYCFSSCSSWAPLGGVIQSDPTAVRDATRVRVFVQGGDGALYTGTLTGAGTGGFTWSGLGGVLVGAPAATSDGSGNVRVFVRGSDSGVYTRVSVGQTWPGFGFQGIGNVATSNPTVVWNGSGAVAFIRGGDNGLWGGTFSSTWGSWSAFGGFLTSNVSAVSTP